MHFPFSMMVTDLDGTLAFDGKVSEENLAVLKQLGRAGVPRVIATGRSAWSTRKTLSPDFPVDILISSTGAGIELWQTAELLRVHHLSASWVEVVAATLVEARISFMLHDPLPENHRYRYYRAEKTVCSDFETRVERHQGICSAWDERAASREASQFLVIDDKHGSSQLYFKLVDRFPELSVVRATSPLDHRSTWIEIFPKEVSKRSALSWLAERRGLNPATIFGIGNDFNDEKFLSWVGTARLLAAAPEELRSKFPLVLGDPATAFARAILAVSA